MALSKPHLGLDKTLLANLKKVEREEDALPITGDLPALRLVIVWHRVSIYSRHPLEYEEESRKYDTKSLATWRRLWLPFEVDYEEAAVAADIPTAELAKQETARLQSLLLVYPDHSTHTHAMSLAVNTYRSRNMRATRFSEIGKRLTLIEQRLGGLQGGKVAKT